MQPAKKRNRPRRLDLVAIWREFLAPVTKKMAASKTSKSQPLVDSFLISASSKIDSSKAASSKATSPKTASPKIASPKTASPKTASPETMNMHKRETSATQPGKTSDHLRRLDVVASWRELLVPVTNKVAADLQVLLVHVERKQAEFNQIQKWFKENRRGYSSKLDDSEDDLGMLLGLVSTCRVSVNLFRKHRLKLQVEPRELQDSREDITVRPLMPYLFTSDHPVEDWYAKLPEDMGLIKTKLNRILRTLKRCTWDLSFVIQTLEKDGPEKRSELFEAESAKAVAGYLIDRLVLAQGLVSDLES